jgi:hypothetical protein
MKHLLADALGAIAIFATLWIALIAAHALA